MYSQSITANILANVHRYARFYLASFLTGVLVLLLLLSARLTENAATPPSKMASVGRLAVVVLHQSATAAGPLAGRQKQ